MLNRLDRLLRLLLTASAFLFFYVGGALLSWLLLPIALLGGGDAARRSARCRAAVGAAFVLFHDYMRICRLIRYDPRELRPKMPTGPCVVVANHPTLIDVTALMAANPQTTCVVKPSLLASPALGKLLRLCWHIGGGTGGLGGADNVIEGSLKRLAAGLPVLLFPEGTRSPEAGLRSFKRGAFEIACQANVPVAPIYITCTPPMLAKEAPWYRAPVVPSRLKIEVLPAMDPKDWGGDSRAMAADAKAGYMRLLAGAELGTWRRAAPSPYLRTVETGDAPTEGLGEQNDAAT